MTARGVMFHRFHNESYPNVQGTIGEDDLLELINHIGLSNILPADVWARRALTGELEETDVCLTFDDALKSQFDVAYPILQDLGITAFWFVYSSVFEGEIEPLEIYRHFRTVIYDDIDAFYYDFFQIVTSEFTEEYERWLPSYDPTTYLAAYPIYTPNDRLFRAIREEFLGPKRYHLVMKTMMARKGADAREFSKQLWMNNEDLKQLNAEGHQIGLHAYTHPTRLADLSFEEQLSEYRRNFDHLSRTLGSKPECMSHPCNSYNQETMRVLRELGIKIGFRADMAAVSNRSMFEFPRQDCAMILQEIRS